MMRASFIPLSAIRPLALRCRKRFAHMTPADRRKASKPHLRHALYELRGVDPIFTMAEADMSAAQLREKARHFDIVAQGKSEHAGYVEASAEAMRLHTLASERTLQLARAA